MNGPANMRASKWFRLSSQEGSWTVANASSQDRTSPPSSRSPDDLVVILMISSRSTVLHQTTFTSTSIRFNCVKPVLQSQGGNFMSASARYSLYALPVFCVPRNGVSFPFMRTLSTTAFKQAAQGVYPEVDKRPCLRITDPPL